MTGQEVPRPAVPMQWHVHGLNVAGLSWGHHGEKPLLALHGWLDNAASFARLAPLLTGYHVVALDLTGHGRSARRSADASYQIWDDLPEILEVLDLLGWDTFHLLGHSRGAIISTLLASAYPERILGLVLLDAIYPESVAEEKFPQQMRTALQDKRRLLSRAGRTFASLEKAVESRAVNGLTAQTVRVMVQRNVRDCPEGVEWITDPRLRGASAVKLTQGQIRAVLQALGMPTLLMLAADSYAHSSRWFELAQGLVTQLQVMEVAGGHHFHMEDCATSVAQNIKEFLSSIAQQVPA